MLITLTEAEQRLVNYLAKRRQANNVAAGVHDPKIGPLTAEQINFIGVGGEIAFARLFNVYPDLSTQPRSGGADCRLGAYAIDVKTTMYPRGHLMAIQTKALHAADAYALVVATFPEYRFCGFATAGDLFHPNNLADLGHYGRDAYVLGQDKLRPDLPIKADDIHWSGQ